MDIFDQVADQKDIFDDVEGEKTGLDKVKREIAAYLDSVSDKETKRENRKVSAEIKDFIREEIAKLRPVQHVIEKIVEERIVRVPGPPPPPEKHTETIKEIHEVRVEAPKDTRKLVEQSAFDALQKKIEELQKELKETRRLADHPIVINNPGGSGVIGIPPPEAATVGQVLTVDSNKKAAWSASQGGSGASISGYTIADATQLKTLPSDASLDDIRQVLGTLIEELQ